jgi:peptidoglycan DL-endopeptidase CwlO
MQIVGVSLCSAVLTLGISTHAEAAALKKGANGGAVYDLQSRLVALGYNPGEVDGVYGQATITAVERFQRDFGLESDGIVGDETRRAIEDAAARSQIVSRGTSARSLVPGIIATSKRYLGVPYVFGGEDPSGFDCSGFVQYVFGKQGIDLPRTADVQYGLGAAVSKSNLQPGDLVFFSTYLPGPSHVGIYLGNGQFINAQSSKGVAIANMSSNYWGSRYVGAKRVLR